ncbi:hypothetical protein RB196_01855 [Streptomyces sp. PmtA]
MKETMGLDQFGRADGEGDPFARQPGLGEREEVDHVGVQDRGDPGLRHAGEGLAVGVVDDEGYVVPFGRLDQCLELGAVETAAGRVRGAGQQHHAHAALPVEGLRVHRVAEGVGPFLDDERFDADDAAGVHGQSLVPGVVRHPRQDQGPDPAVVARAGEEGRRDERQHLAAGAEPRCSPGRSTSRR